MGPGYFVIAILGCADGGTGCTPVATLPRHYASADQCSAAAAPALEANSNFDFPTLLAHPVLRTLLIVGLCALGFAFSITGVVIGWRRLRLPLR